MFFFILQKVSMTNLSLTTNQHTQPKFPNSKIPNTRMTSTTEIKAEMAVMRKHEAQSWKLPAAYQQWGQQMVEDEWRRVASRMSLVSSGAVIGPVYIGPVWI